MSVWPFRSFKSLYEASLQCLVTAGSHGFPWTWCSNATGYAVMRARHSLSQLDNSFIRLAKSTYYTKR